MNDRNRKTDTNEIDSRKQPLWYSGRYFDYPLFGIVLGLVLFGLVMVYSTSSYRADELYGDSTYFAKRQLVFELVALVGMFLVSKIDYRRYARYSKYFLYVAIALLVLVYIIGSASHGSTRWIYIGAFGFQPSEFAKLALIVYTADICTRKPRSLNTIKGLAKMLLLPLITIVLIAIENLSTAIICFGIVMIIVFVASPKNWHFILMGVLGILMCVVFIATAGYRADRIRIWLAPEKYDDGYQTMQSLYAIGSGGFFGRGLGNSIQKMGFIPESHNDMIFSVICEELGLFGAVLTIIMFILLIYRCTVLAINSGDRFGGLIAVGVMAHIAVQVLINISVVTNTIPPTGVPLPFISYGLSSLVSMSAGIGLVLNINLQKKKY